MYFDPFMTILDRFWTFRNHDSEIEEKGPSPVISIGPLLETLGKPFPYLFLLGLLGATRLQGPFEESRN